jgi:hypothetical protein
VGVFFERWLLRIVVTIVPPAQLGQEGLLSMDTPQLDPDTSDAESRSLLGALAMHLQQRGYAPRTVTECDHAARHFLSWLGRNGARTLPSQPPVRGQAARS